ncbi:MAG: phosphatidylserine/phosphatidylglycerophosphate/cardiolipin synthase family protein [Bacteroidetes bacterium]|nr:phosphatidylserine/phosphatidylglycerophosphate/cardiolipin synthase family protein [Bacteroidota bacterium]
MKEIKEPYQLFDDPIKCYTSMLEDIESAQKNIYLETFRIGNDSIGIRFKDALTEKVKQGLEVKILIDSWGGSAVSDSFFEDFILYGGELRFFEKIKYNLDLFTTGHRRNHRKLLIIDEMITYIGSSNLTEYNLNWRELVLRITGEIAQSFMKVFFVDYKMYKKYVFDKARLSTMIRHEDSEIVRDVPSITVQRIKKRYVQLIKNARHQVLIETPYFLPGFLLRKALMDAAKRGVEVIVIIPKHSDVGLVDILRNKYLGPLHKSKIKFLFYLPHNLHAKAMLIDNEIYSIGSPNFDYRTFRYMYEITLIGQEKEIVNQLNLHIRHTMENSEGFYYKKWKDRPRINKFFEWLLLPFRHLL